jgi:4-hydroxybenzoate polyprenyltransferase
MDDTLLQTDTLIESALLLVRHHPFCLLLLPVWLWGGRAHLKRRIAERIRLDVATLPVNAPLLAGLIEQRDAGRPLHLFSAADQSIVAAVAARFGIFQSAHGSDGIVNLSGARKLAAIQDAVGPRFTYAGDSRKDLPVWHGGGSAVLVGAVDSLRAALGPDVLVEAGFAVPRPTLQVWRRALRLHQWAKNLLIFLAVLLGGNIIGDLPVSLLAFLTFGLIASATYLLNDMLDLPHDRLHRTKRRRPLASGDLPLRQAMIGVGALGLAACLLLLALPGPFALATALYLVVTLAYSAHVKRRIMLDVFTLAGLFTIRIGAGITMVHHPLTPWLMAFSMFFFLSLACVKRYSECLVMAAEGLQSLPGRAYRPADAPWLMAMGAASGFSAMSTFFLFLVETGSPILLYPNPQWMWLICVILGYWICRTWALAVRGLMNDDPVLFAMKDRLSLLLAAVTAVLVLLARR